MGKCLIVPHKPFSPALSFLSSSFLCLVVFFVAILFFLLRQGANRLAVGGSM
jgi:hypothetical protein